MGSLGATRLAAIAVVCLAIGLAVGFGASSSPTSDPASPEARAPESPSGTVEIGILMPLTGDQATHGTENAAGAMLGVSDFNAHLETIGADWRLRGVTEDTATNPVVALDKFTVLNARGIPLVMGPDTSAAVRAMKGYSDSNGMLMFSPSSTASSLAIPNDSVFRMITDDTKQGPAIAAMTMHFGNEVMIPVYRGDPWGDGLSKTSIASFKERGGIVDEGIRYNPETVEFSAEMSLLAEKVDSYAESVGLDKVAILLISFTESVQIMQSASNYDSLAGVQWIGTAGSAKEHLLVTDPVAREFSTGVKFTTLQISASRNDIYNDVNERLGVEFGGREFNEYAFTSYDVIWVLGTAILHTGTEDPAVLKGVLREVAGRHYGAIGPITLNEAGDLDTANYDLWAIHDGEWEHIGQYRSGNDGVVII